MRVKCFNFFENGIYHATYPSTHRFHMLETVKNRKRNRLLCTSEKTRTTVSTFSSFVLNDGKLLDLVIHVRFCNRCVLKPSNGKVVISTLLFSEILNKILFYC